MKALTFCEIRRPQIIMVFSYRNKNERKRYRDRLMQNMFFLLKKWSFVFIHSKIEDDSLRFITICSAYLAAEQNPQPNCVLLVQIIEDLQICIEHALTRRKITYPSLARPQIVLGLLHEGVRVNSSGSEPAGRAARQSVSLPATQKSMTSSK